MYTDGSYGAAGNGVLEVYAIKNGKVKKAAEFTNRTAASSFMYHGKTRTIWSEISSAAYGYLDRYQYKNGKLKGKYCCGFDAVSGMKYYIKSPTNLVSEQTYKKYLKKYFTSVKWKTYHLKELTAKSIKNIY